VQAGFEPLPAWRCHPQNPFFEIVIAELTFRDELDMEQTVVFKIKKTDKAPSAIRDRVVEAKKLEK
jgi:hypothetical protein